MNKNFAQKFTVFSFILLMLVLITSCGKDSDDARLNPQDARNQLDTMNIRYNEESFKKSILENDVKVVRLFLDAGMDVNYKFNDKDNTVAFILAVDKSNSDVVKAFLSRGVDINIKNKSYDTALIVATNNNNTDIVKLLLSNKTKLERLDTALDIAAAQNNADITRALLASGANVTSHTLIKACEKGSLDTVKLLIEKIADINARDAEDQTPLMFAALSGNPELVKLLLDKGAFINAKDKLGHSVLGYAASSGDVKTMQLLIDKGISTDIVVLNDALGYSNISKNNDDVIKLLLKYGASINGDNIGYSPLIWAILCRNMESIRSLIANGADVNYTNINDGYTPLMHAMMKDIHGEYDSKKSIDILELLISSGADVNKTDKNGETPIFKAVRWDKIDIIKYLFLNKADLNLATKAGVTPLQFAISDGKIGIANYLRSNGAK